MDPAVLQAQNRLIGALVGLARATYNTVQPTLPAYLFIIDTLDTFNRKSPLDKKMLTDLIHQAHQQKYTVAPDCAACGAPCGRTNDFDLADLDGYEAEVLPMKWQLFRQLCQLATCLATTQQQLTADSLYPAFFADAMFAFGEDWTARELAPILQELQQLSQPFQG